MLFPINSEFAHIMLTSFLTFFICLIAWNTWFVFGLKLKEPTGKYRPTVQSDFKHMLMHRHSALVCTSSYHYDLVQRKTDGERKLGIHRN